MSLIDDFFAAKSWDVAVPGLLSRSAELLDDEAGSAFRRRADSCGRSEAAHQVLRLYLALLQAAARHDSIALHAAMRHLSSVPKLTDRDFANLAAVHDVPSARAFTSSSPDIVEQLIAGHGVRGEPFWLLLLSGARKAPGSSATGAASFAKTTLVVREADAAYRVAKFLPLKDGGFAITTPYHRARSGSLFKHPTTERTGSFETEVSQMTPFVASDRVKLSYHVDGFVQFSGEDSSKIVSGRDEHGRPKGLGLMARPLAAPVETGPCAGCSVWGLAEFEAWKPRASEGAIVFHADEDFYTEPEDRDADQRRRQPGYTFSLFVLPPALLEAAIGGYDTGDEIDVPIPMNIYHRQRPFRVKLVRLTTHTTLGVIAKRQEFGWENPSGFQLASPGDGQHVMFAMYPSMPMEGTSIDYHGDAAPDRIRSKRTE
jgi:hypothetical protein